MAFWVDPGSGVNRRPDLTHPCRARESPRTLPLWHVSRISRNWDGSVLAAHGGSVPDADQHIEYYVEHAVVQGYDDGYYHPEYVVTRDQMAVYVARAFQLPM